MKIAVTGASGFIGAELLEELRGIDNTEIIGLTRGGSAAADAPFCVWRTTDYSEESLREAIRGADSVIHLAGVRGTTADPQDYVINEEMTENLLKAMTAEDVKRIVFASTISVYDDVSLIPWTEASPLKGRTMYGESKISCEQLIRRYSDKYGITYGIVRIAQVLGKGEKRRGMMNVFLDTAREHGQLRVIGKSEAKRQYIYVKDLVKILAGLAVSDENITVNAGMPNAYTNLEIGEIINRVYGNPVPIDYDDSKPETIKASFMDTKRLRTLGYEPADMEKAVSDLIS